MTEKKQQPAHTGSYTPQVPASYNQNDDIDLRELFLTLWQGKWIILALTVFMAVLASVYAVKQPNIYETEATVVLNDSFYSLDDTYQLSLSPHLLTGIF